MLPPFYLPERRFCFSGRASGGMFLEKRYRPNKEMIDKLLLTEVIEEGLSGTDAFVVEINITPANEITVELDSDTGLDIETCVRLTRLVESRFDRDVEDYQLEVGSAGLTAPFKVKRQYDKNVGNEVEVLTRDGRKLSGILEWVSDDGLEFTILTKEKVREEGKKRPVIVDKPLTIKVADTKTVKYSINFK